MKTVKFTLVPWVAASAALAGNVAIADTAPGSIAEMVTKGSASVSMRYRYESVEQDNALKDADASTLKSRLTLKSGSYKGFSALLELDNVSVLGSDDYDSFRVGESQRGVYSVVADPVGTGVNQAWLKYSFSDAASTTAGRQRILHAGQRFVGGVGWRQNEQTYDAASFNYATGAVTLDYSYVWGVDRIFGGEGSSVQEPYFSSDAHLLLATSKIGSGKLTGMVYALDFDEPAGFGASSITYGIGYAGSIKSFSYDLTYARQSDYGDNPNSYDADYIGIDTKLAVSPVTLGLGYELLGSDDGVAGFSTPLATLHKFQGWADLFLATPANGIEDIYGGIAGKIGPVALAAWYHDFSADEGGADYGSEVDLVATWTVNPKFNVELKYADYDADEFAVDTKKLWFTMNYTF